MSGPLFVRISRSRQRRGQWDGWPGLWSLGQIQPRVGDCPMLTLGVGLWDVMVLGECQS